MAFIIALLTIVCCSDCLARKDKMELNPGLMSIALLSGAVGLNGNCAGGVGNGSNNGSVETSRNRLAWLRHDPCWGAPG